MSIEDLRLTWDTLGRTDPLWAVLSDPAKRNNRWDQQEFFRTGEVEIAALFEHLDGRGWSIDRGRCLDFGCGVGRLSQAFCAYFHQVDAVDIAASMIDRAREINQHGDRCRYHINVCRDLAIFDTATFDLVYSTIVLQHMPPDLAEAYIREFVRLVAPGGMIVFQLPSEPVGPESPYQAILRLVSPDLPTRLHPRSRAQLTVEVTNASPVPWESGTTLRIGNHWLDGEGRMVTLDDGRTAIGRRVDPGERVVVELEITAPQLAGPYTLELDVVKEGVTWFANRGSKTLRGDVAVGARRPGSVMFHRWRRLTRQRAQQPAEAKPEEAPFENYAIPKRRVVEVVESAGGDVIAAEEYFVSGPEWDNYRYFVRKPVASPERISYEHRQADGRWPMADGRWPMADGR